MTASARSDIVHIVDGRITLPIDVREDLGLEEGTYVVVAAAEGGLRIQKCLQVARSDEGDHPEH